jgi:hypothetical protein
LLLSVDFWVVKNVSGRLLVGLRWWNQIRPDGTSSWVFESRQQQNQRSSPTGSGENFSHEPINPTDYRLFWWSLYGFAGFWIFLSFIALIQFAIKWLLVAIVASILNMANVIGFTRCDKAAKKKILGDMSESVVGGLLRSQWHSFWPTDTEISQNSSVGDAISGIANLRHASTKPVNLTSESV